MTKWKTKQQTTGRKYSQHIYLTKDVHSECSRKSYKSTLKHEKHPNKDRAISLNRSFIKEDIQMANKHMKRWPASVVIREAPIKTKLRYHFTPTGFIKNTDNIKCWWELWNWSTHTPKVGVQSEIITWEKQFWQFSIKLNIYLPEDPAISLLFTAGKWKQVSKKKKKLFKNIHRSLIHTRIKWETIQMSITREWINKLWCVQIINTI